LDRIGSSKEAPSMKLFEGKIEPKDVAQVFFRSASFWFDDVQLLVKNGTLGYKRYALGRNKIKLSIKNGPPLAVY
jgi:hypothetical protein